MVARRFEVVPLWGRNGFLAYAPRRVGRGWGRRIENMPCADGKHPVTQAYARFLANWAKRVLEEEVAEDSSGQVVLGAVERAVA